MQRMRDKKVNMKPKDFFKECSIDSLEYYDKNCIIFTIITRGIKKSMISFKRAGIIWKKKYFLLTMLKGRMVYGIEYRVGPMYTFAKKIIKNRRYRMPYKDKKLWAQMKEQALLEAI